MKMKNFLVVAVLAIAGFFMFSRKTKAAPATAAPVTKTEPGTSPLAPQQSSVVPPTTAKIKAVYKGLNRLLPPDNVKQLVHNDFITGYPMADGSFKYVYDSMNDGPQVIYIKSDQWRRQ